MFVVTNVLLTIPSTRNDHYLLILILSTRPPSQWLLLTCICLFHPPGIFYFSSIAYSTGSRLYLLALTSQFSIPQEASLSLIWTMPFPPSSRELLLPLATFITGLWTSDLFVIPFIGNWTEVLTLSFPATSSRQVAFSFSAFITSSLSCWWWWWFQTIPVNLYGLVIFEDKCHSC